MYRKWPQNAKWFESQEGWLFVFHIIFLTDPEFLSDDCNVFFLLSQDGQHFTELAVDLETLNTTQDGFELRLEEPRAGKLYEITVTEDMSKATIDGMVFTGIETREEVKFTPLPRIPEYLYQLPNGDFVYVSTGYQSYDYDTFKLFFGPGKQMEEANITHRVDRMSDGGTTWVITDKGDFFSPSPYRQKPASWNDIEVTRLDPKQYDITEEGNHCTIKRKS